jgi:hypothetical protein
MLYVGEFDGADFHSVDSSHICKAMLCAGVEAIGAGKKTSAWLRR